MKELDYYLKFAERLIRKFAQRYSARIDISEDFISYVAHRIMKGDENFSIDKVKSPKRESLSVEECKKLYLKQCGIYGIRAYMTLKKKQKEKEPCILFSDIFDYSNFVHIDSYMPVSKYDTPLEVLCKEDDKTATKSLLNVFVSSSGLTDNEANVVKKRLEENKTFSEIAKESNVTIQAVNIAYQKALKKMSCMTKGV